MTFYTSASHEKTHGFATIGLGLPVARGQYLEGANAQEIQEPIRMYYCLLLFEVLMNE